MFMSKSNKERFVGAFSAAISLCIQINTHTHASGWKFKFNAISRHWIDMLDTWFSSVESLEVTVCINQINKSKKTDHHKNWISTFCSRFEKRKPDENVLGCILFVRRLWRQLAIDELQPRWTRMVPVLPQIDFTTSRGLYDIVYRWRCHCHRN